MRREDDVEGADERQRLPPRQPEEDAGDLAGGQVHGRHDHAVEEEPEIHRTEAAHDAGRVINPALASGQIVGAIHMGLGYALTEELRCENGMPVTFKLKEIGVLRARDMPHVDVILVEEPEPEGPMGAKGIGEIGLVPTAAAVASALQRFDGIRRYTLPMKDSPAARAMSVGFTLLKS